MKRMLKGFTLVEIMIVVAIIAILAAVAIPNFVKYRRSSQAAACVSNLKQIQAAKEQSLMAGKGVTSGDLFGADKLIKVEPHCPAQACQPQHQWPLRFHSGGLQRPVTSNGRAGAHPIPPEAHHTSRPTALGVAAHRHWRQS